MMLLLMLFLLHTRNGAEFACWMKHLKREGKHKSLLVLFCARRTLEKAAAMTKKNIHALHKTLNEMPFPFEE
jgi:hypothetical protein